VGIKVRFVCSMTRVLAHRHTSYTHTHMHTYAHPPSPSPTHPPIPYAHRVQFVGWRVLFVLSTMRVSTTAEQVFLCTWICTPFFFVCIAHICVYAQRYSYVCMCIYIYICMCVCMYVCTCVCMFVIMFHVYFHVRVFLHLNFSLCMCLYACLKVRMCACLHVCMYYVCMYVCISLWMYVCLYVCLYGCMYVCMYVSMLPWWKYANINHAYIHMFSMCVHWYIFAYKYVHIYPEFKNIHTQVMTGRLTDANKYFGCINTDLYLHKYYV